RISGPLVPAAKPKAPSAPRQPRTIAARTASGSSARRCPSPARSLVASGPATARVASPTLATSSHQRAGLGGRLTRWPDRGFARDQRLERQAADDAQPEAAQHGQQEQAGKRLQMRLVEGG